ncbi:MAG: hypothetical protein WC269_02915 [Candidatus Gracilibacteria bacterium]|jgi:hypothetical protein
MYNQKFINVLLNILGWITVVGTVIFFISGFFVESEKAVSAAEKAGYIFGYEVAGLAMIAFFYVILGVLYRVNNKGK